MDDQSPLCPHCRQPMRLTGIIPRLGGQPELQTFSCRQCKEAVTQVVGEAKERPPTPA